MNGLGGNRICSSEGGACDMKQQKRSQRNENAGEGEVVIRCLCKVERIKIHNQTSSHGLQNQTVTVIPPERIMKRDSRQRDSRQIIFFFYCDTAFLTSFPFPVKPALCAISVLFRIYTSLFHTSALLHFPRVLCLGQQCTE